MGFLAPRTPLVAAPRRQPGPVGRSMRPTRGQGARAYDGGARTELGGPAPGQDWRLADPPPSAADLVHPARVEVGRQPDRRTVLDRDQVFDVEAAQPRIAG